MTAAAGGGIAAPGGPVHQRPIMPVPGRVDSDGPGALVEGPPRHQSTRSEVEAVAVVVGRCHIVGRVPLGEERGVVDQAVPAVPGVERGMVTPPKAQVGEVGSHSRFADVTVLLDAVDVELRPARAKCHNNVHPLARGDCRGAEHVHDHLSPVQVQPHTDDVVGAVVGVEHVEAVRTVSAVGHLQDVVIVVDRAHGLGFDPQVQGLHSGQVHRPVTPMLPRVPLQIDGRTHLPRRRLHRVSEHGQVLPAAPRVVAQVVGVLKAVVVQRRVPFGVVVEDGSGQCSVFSVQCRVDRARERELDRLGALRRPIVDDRDGDDPRGLTGLEGDRVPRLPIVHGPRSIVLPQHGRAAGHVTLDRGLDPSRCGKGDGDLNDTGGLLDGDGSLLESNRVGAGQAEAEADGGLVVGRGVTAVRGAAILGAREAAAAAEDAPRARRETVRVRCRPRIRSIPVQAPFFDVPMHVIQAPGVRLV